MHGLSSNIQSLLDSQSELNEPKRPQHLQMHLEILKKNTNIISKCELTFFCRTLQMEKALEGT